jgi:hypothetical protein
MAPNGCIGYYCQPGITSGTISVEYVGARTTPLPTVSAVSTVPDTVISGPQSFPWDFDVSNNGAVNVQSSGTVTLSVGSPVNQMLVFTVYQYFPMAVLCNAGYNGGYPGWMWSGTKWVSVGTPGQADLYVTSSSCTGAFAVSGDPGTLHFPGGGALFSQPLVAFYQYSATQWIPSETALSYASLETNQPCPYVLIAKTRTGAIFKLFIAPESVQTPAGYAHLAGAIEVSGAGVDGF